MRWNYMIVVLLALGTAPAQTTQAGNESALGAEFRLERGRFDTSCLGKPPDKSDSQGRSIAGCAQVLFTDHPLHIAVGSIAPQNGFGAGLALVTHYDATKWFFKWDVDTIGSVNGSWRAGVYMTIIRATAPQIKPKIKVHGIGDSQPQGNDAETPIHSKLAVSPYPVFNIYVQGISLNKLGFFGLGQNTTTAGRSFFGMTQSIVGGNAIIPVRWTRGLNLSLLGEANGRFVDIRGAHGQPSPSIEVLYTPATAPGLASQPGFIQFGEGLRVAPKFEYLYFDYKGNFQQFVAPGNSTFSFRRFNLDLSHEIPLYGHSKNKPQGNTNVIVTTKVDLTDPDLRKKNGPDECGTQDRDLTCPSVRSTLCDAEDVNHKCTEVRSAVSRNREGSLGLRLLISESVASGGSVVPFYFQPTLGGTDVNGSPALSSYQDYRFRAPNILLLHQSFDHSLYGPVGITLMADEGKAALTRGDIEFQHLRHSFAAGLNIRAGGLPAVQLLFAWGGREGSHIISSVNTALLGGSPRPSLY
jgi:hypothetical protein